MMRSVILLGLAMAVGACGAPYATYYADDFSPLYRRSAVFVAGGQGPVPVLIRGNPFPGVDAMRLSAATLAGMARSAAIAPARLTTGDPGARSVDYRFIVAFGEPQLGANGLCAAPDAPFASGEPLTATAAFCIGDRLLSTTRGRLHEAADSPEGEVFQGFVHGLTNAMLPPHNPRMRPCGALPVC